MEVPELYEIVKTIKDDINKNTNEHFEYIKDQIQILLDGKEDSDQEINHLKDRVKTIEFDIVLIKREGQETANKVIKWEEAFEQFKKEIKGSMKKLGELITTKKITWVKIATIVLGILSTPVITLLVNAWLKAKGWL